jgi:hypothetical protein
MCMHVLRTYYEILTIETCMQRHASDDWTINTSSIAGHAWKRNENRSSGRQAATESPAARPAAKARRPHVDTARAGRGQAGHASSPPRHASASSWEGIDGRNVCAVA